MGENERKQQATQRHKAIEEVLERSKSLPPAKLERWLERANRTLTDFLSKSSCEGFKTQKQGV